MENYSVAWCGLFARFIGFLTRTERRKCLERIKEIGVEAFAKEMNAKGQMSIRK